MLSSSFSSVTRVIDMKELDRSGKLVQLVSMVAFSSVSPYYFTLQGFVTDNSLNDDL